MSLFYVSILCVGLDHSCSYYLLKYTMRRKRRITQTCNVSAHFSTTQHSLASHYVSEIVRRVRKDRHKTGTKTKHMVKTGEQL